MLSVVGIILASLSLHRLWNFEALFSKPRMWFENKNFMPISCPPCNAFWVLVFVALVAYLGGIVTPLEALVSPFIGYGFLRTVLWLTLQPLENLFQPKQSCHREQPTQPKPVNKVSAPTQTDDNGPQPIPKKTEGECKSCKEKADLMNAEAAAYRSYTERVAIFPGNPTNKEPWIHGQLLSSKKNRLVTFWINKELDLGDLESRLPANVEVRRIVDKSDVDETVKQIQDRVIKMGNAHIVTYDWDNDEFIKEVVSKVGQFPATAWVLLGKDATSDFTNQTHLSLGAVIEPEQVKALENVIKTIKPYQPPQKAVIKSETTA